METTQPQFDEPDRDFEPLSGWQLDGQGPGAYERLLAPAFFAPCAEQLLSLVELSAGARVLDVACGTGVVARRAAAAVGAAGSVVGVDVNNGMLAVAAAVAEAEQLVIEWRTADATTLPLRNDSIDVVCCQQGLQFFSDQSAALGEMRRVLVPGGRIALAAWRKIEHCSIFSPFVAALQRHVGDEAAAIMRSPFAAPDRDGLRQLMTDAGFRDSRVRIGIIAVRFPTVAEFLRAEAVSSPLQRHVGALDADGLKALVRELDETLTPHLDDDGLTFPMQTWLVTALRP